MDNIVFNSIGGEDMSFDPRPAGRARAPPGHPPRSSTNPVGGGVSTCTK